MAPENKTRESDASVADFLARVESAAQRADALKLADMLRRVTGEEPRMWGPTIVGYGRYRYRYDSGREGEAGRIGFSPRKAALVVYIVGGFPRHQALMDRLGKYTTGKSCLYIKKLADVDMVVLEELARESLAYMAEKYPT
jgi:hypothetical protein